MVHHVASCHECGTQISARDHCQKCNDGKKLSYRCPHCTGFILVDKFSIEPDVKRVREMRIKHLENAARDVVNVVKSDDPANRCMDRFVLVERSLFDNLEEAIRDS